ncbi:MAG: hypothetical protein KY397_00785, partial [Gemmatimonadetes bacterium]|nr:hypothetical protein [Gemmatimonadota bacterium]
YQLDRSPSPDVKTAVSGDRLRSINEELLQVPEGFTIHPKLVKQLERRREAVGPEGGIDWAHAEALAFASLLTEGIPVLDMTKAMAFVRDRGARLVGPNCPGLISPGKCKVGILPGQIVKPGRIGLVSRSGTLTYEVIHHLTGADLGQSTCIGIGGDPIIGTTFIDALELFEGDPDTDAVVMIGEIGGTDEQEAAAWVDSEMSIPVVGFIAGRTAPPGRRMGHAGAIISGSEGTAAEKIAAFREHGIEVAERPAEIVGLVEGALARA